MSGAKGSRTSELGFSLIGTMVAVAISGIVAVGLATLFKHSFSAQKHTELRGDLDALRHQILDAISCPATLNQADNPNYVPGPPQDCKGDIDLYRLDPKTGAPVVFLKSGSTVGRWTIRSSCNNNELLVQAARPNGTSGFFTDPLNGEALDWKNPHGELFGEDHPSPCTTPPPSGPNLHWPGSVVCYDPDDPVNEISLPMNVANESSQGQLQKGHPLWSCEVGYWNASAGATLAYHVTSPNCPDPPDQSNLGVMQCVVDGSCTTNGNYVTFYASIGGFSSVNPAPANYVPYLCPAKITPNGQPIQW